MTTPKPIPNHDPNRDPRLAAQQRPASIDKDAPEIDGPRPDAIETDEVYDDPRHHANLPPAGKNAADLHVNDLGKGDK